MAVKIDLCHSIGRTEIEGVWEQGAEENIWIKEGWSDRGAEETTLLRDVQFVLLTKYC
jgi:hypothetical protein